MFERFIKPKSQENAIPELLRAEDVRKILKVSLPYVHKLAERHKLPSVRYPGLGKKGKKEVVRFRKDDVLSFVNQHYKA